MSPEQMTPRERRAAISLAGIFATRMLGLFLILPVFALYAEDLEGVTPTLVGVAIGIYGLTQALFQIPFGMLSDRIGRKPVIVAGLLLFAIGSAIAATADTINGVIIGRTLQGSGAVAAAIMALAADLTREEHRPKAMAVIGMTIGVSFLIAMVAGPVLDGWVGVPGIFWLTAVLALAGIAILLIAVPTPADSRVHRDAEAVSQQFRQVLADTQLLRLDFGILVLHLVLTAGFVVLPLALRDAGLVSSDHWQLYLPVMVFAMAGAIPFIVLAEKKRLMKPIVIGGIALLGLSEIGFVFLHDSFWPLAVLMGLFFIAFNLMEALMPSLIAKTAPVQSKGTAMGVYSSSQFFGAFIGGAAGGSLYGQFGPAGVFLFCAILLAAWWLLAITMKQPRYLASAMVNVGPLDSARAAELEGEICRIDGVEEAYVGVDDGIAYLRIDNDKIDRAELDRFSI
ncbi:MFS transporter [Thiohalomonas denitrificans]|uniref:Predicted arabinose efflux permease, MFS family n=1 Tax=Thiohalomonas denitrificans TaxID=415747 RepID=A0A1G5R214_9GAMM|nr:MFS transporter [Thiohalomonas denitrificans]SCZ68047.1 Predicted arabinose efflux permease, MFS family [Thiohalomonas denitrificans]